MSLSACKAPTSDSLNELAGLRFQELRCAHSRIRQVRLGKIFRLHVSSCRGWQFESRFLEISGLEWPNNQKNRYFRYCRFDRELGYKKHIAMKRHLVLCCILLLTLASGCLNQIRDEFDDTRVANFNRNLAWAAFCEASPLYCNIDCPYSFKLGFTSGFIAVANGGNGCPPVFPPSSRVFSTAWLDDGTPEEKRNAWYDGYAHGVLAANQTGASDINRIPARLPHRQVFDPSVPNSAPSEFAPLLPSPTPVRMYAETPAVVPGRVDGY